MKEIFGNFLNLNTRKVIERKVVGPIEYEKYFFTDVQIKKLQNLNFPLEVKSDIPITELHLKNVMASREELRNSIEKIKAESEGYVIGVSWIAQALRRYGFTIEDISPEIAKQFSVGHAVQNQDKIVEKFLEKLGQLQSRQGIEIEENGEKRVIDTLLPEEKKELENMENTLIGYEKLVEKKGGKIDFADIKLAWFDKRQKDSSIK